MNAQHRKECLKCIYFKEKGWRKTLTETKFAAQMLSTQSAHWFLDIFIYYSCIWHIMYYTGLMHTCSQSILGIVLFLSLHIKCIRQDTCTIFHEAVISILLLPSLRQSPCLKELRNPLAMKSEGRHGRHQQGKSKNFRDMLSRYLVSFSFGYIVQHLKSKCT